MERCHSLARLCLSVRDLIRRCGGIVASSSFIRLLSTGCHAGDDEEAWLAPLGYIRSLRRKQQAGWMDKTGTKVLRFSIEGQMILSICPQRQIFRPVRRNRHEPAGFLQRTLTNGLFNDRLIVDVEHHGVAVLFQRQQRMSQNIPCNGLRRSFPPASRRRSPARPSARPRWAHSNRWRRCRSDSP